MKVAFYTLGCKVNQYETESMREQLANNGFECGCRPEDADIIIINSCTVTAESDRKTRQAVRKFRRLAPNAAIVLCGCLPAAFPEVEKALPEADIIFANSGDGILIDAVNEYLTHKNRIVRVKRHEKGELFRTPPITDFSERTRAFVKIEDGCDRFCSYCIIPTARGRVRSRSLASLKTEIEKLAERGFCEVVLVGINLSAYGKDNSLSLCDAVDTAASVDGIKRVRLGSLEPDHISEEMLKRFRECEKFCPQFHLSLQSGCDETLKRMNRHYDSAFYRRLVERIREVFPDAAITTDIMVGFAGETDEEFSRSLAFAREIGFAKAHVFAYSRRKGTKADLYPDQVSNAKKAERSHEMLAACDECERRFLDSQLGVRFPVLFETFENGFCEGYSPNYTRVRAEGDERLCGKICDVLAVSRDGDCIIAKII